jgi:3-dehydroquinate synthase
MDNSLILVRLEGRSYDIAINHDQASGLADFVRRRAPGHLAIVIADASVSGFAGLCAQVIAGAGLRIEMTTLSGQEGLKSLAQASALYDRLADWKADRQTLVVAIGGGVIGDLAGFVAATFARGIPFLIIPTTLLAMVDSSVGGKVAINHRRGKNLIGAFHQPVGVWIDLSVLDTLPDREYRCGLAEVVKYGAAIDAELFAYLESHVDALKARDLKSVAAVVNWCCRLKASVVERDERDTSGERAALNYGHTFAHAVETMSGYGSWRHGEAVAMGMECAAGLAQRMGLLAPGEMMTERQSRLLSGLDLPIRLPPMKADELIDVMASDKKAQSGAMRFVLPRRVGTVELTAQVSRNDLASVLRDKGATGSSGH